MNFAWFVLLVLGVEPINAKVINQDGVGYVCLIPDDAQKLLQLRLDFPILQKQTQKYEELALIMETENKRLTNAVSDLSNQLVMQNQLSNALQSIVNKPIPWYKSLPFWTFAGIVVGAAVTVFVYEMVDTHDNGKLTTTSIGR